MLKNKVGKLRHLFYDDPLFCDKVLRYVNGGIMRENKNNKFDEYFTKPEIAKKYYEKTREIISQYENLNKYFWLEPSVGDGCFFSLLDKKSA